MWQCLVTLLVLMLLSSCGGGGNNTVAPTAPQVFRRALQAVLERQPQALVAAAPAAAGASVDPADAANQLMDFAETSYAAYFPSHQPTAAFDGYLYRYYATTGMYLGVKDGNVYVLGGPFGDQPLLVGPLTAFITPVAPPPPLPAALCALPGDIYSTSATPAATVGKNATAVIAGCTIVINEPRWRQLSGPVVTLVSDKTQAISFEPPQAGSYGFEVNFLDAAGVPRTQAVVIHATGGAQPTLLTARASHAVRMGGKVSLRAWPTLAPGDAVAAVTWEQLEGPAVTLDTTESRLVLFTAPTVTRDTLIRLRATLRTTAGATDSDEVWVLVERYQQATDNHAMWLGDHISRVYAYKPQGSYAAVLRECIYDAGQADAGPNYNLCLLSKLPFLGQQATAGVPSIEQIMDRVLVSHDWLGKNFEDFLRSHDGHGDFRRMLGSVTAIVLGSHVRPSFYYPGTGAIYLDGDDLWRTPVERDTVNEAPDYRSAFGNGLQFESPWRYVHNNQSIFAVWDTRERATRSMDDLRNELAWLLYHELGHALDFLPPSQYRSLDNRKGAWSNIAPRYSRGQLPSDVVASTFPLTSMIMQGLAQVKFRGSTASVEQLAFTPDVVAAAFSIDSATDEYSYTTPREDTAMTLEEFLMAYRQGIQRDVAVTDPRVGKASTSSLIVRWGQRGRVGEEAIKPRAAYLVQELTPWIDATEPFRVAAPTPMRVGESWGANLAQPAALRMAKPLRAQPEWMQRQQNEREIRRRDHYLHRGAPPMPPLPAR